MLHQKFSVLLNRQGAKSWAYSDLLLCLLLQCAYVGVLKLWLLLAGL